MKLTGLVRLPGNEAAAEVPYPWLSIPPYVDNRMAEGVRFATALVRVSLTRNPSPLI
jgi:hypothetical protein